LQSLPVTKAQGEPSNFYFDNFLLLLLFISWDDYRAELGLFEFLADYAVFFSSYSVVVKGE